MLIKAIKSYLKPAFLHLCLNFCCFWGFNLLNNLTGKSHGQTNKPAVLLPPGGRLAPRREEKTSQT